MRGFLANLPLIGSGDSGLGGSRQAKWLRTLLTYFRASTAENVLYAKLFDATCCDLDQRQQKSYVVENPIRGRKKREFDPLFKMVGIGEEAGTWW